jgi:hypothetical protein
MINALNQKRQIFQKQLLQEIQEYHYRFIRYHIDYSIVFAYISEEDGDLSTCSCHIRESDMIIFFQTNFCALIFDNTNEEQGIKAANNLLSRIQNRFFAKHLYMTIINATTEQSEFQMVHDLFDLLAFALDHRMDNLVVDSSQIILD